METQNRSDNVLKEFHNNGGVNERELGDEILTYGETQVNLIRANIFKRRTVNSSLKRWMKCTHCLTMFSTKASLARHLKRFNCKEESRELNSLSYLSLSEIKEAIYGSKFKKKLEEKNCVSHLKENTQAQSNANQNSGAAVHDKEESTEAVSRGDEVELMSCEYCSKTFTQKQTLNAHLITHRRQQHLCPVCGKQFSYKSSLVAHQIVHQKLPKSHVCGQCNAAFTTMRSLRRHYFTHYNSGDKEFICELCGKRFAYSMTLKNHKLSHSEERPHVCRICGTSFKRTTHLRTHEQGVHGLQDLTKPKKYTCAICEKSMVKKESLEAHMKEHTGELNYQCKDCHKKFATNTGLNIHIAMERCFPRTKPCNVCIKDFRMDEPVCEHLRAKSLRRRAARTKTKQTNQEKSVKKKLPTPRHMKEKNHFCKVCGKHYIYPSELKTHFRLAHTDEKPYVCGKCGKAFKTKATLQMHEDVHNDLRPHKCDVCQKRFRKTEHLKLHIRTHTGEKPHVCEICGRGFAQKGDMKKHILKTHNKSIPQKDIHPPEVIKKNGQNNIGNSRVKVEIEDVSVEPADVNRVKNEITERETSSVCDTFGESFESNAKDLGGSTRKLRRLVKVKCNICCKEMTNKSFQRHATEVHNQEVNVSQGQKFGGEAEKGIGEKISCIKQERGEHPGGTQETLCETEIDEEGSDGFKTVNLSYSGMECKTCKKFYSNEVNLKKHIYNVHKMAKVKCRVCEKEVTKKSMVRHMKSVHSAKVPVKRDKKLVPEEEKISCVLCDKKCLNLLSLQYHVKTIHEAEQFKCNQCDFRGIKRLLDKHIKKEHSDEVHQCNKCQKILKSKSTLKEHMWIHTDHRRFICDICGMRFKRTSNYHGHLKSHQEKKFQCQLCGNFFLRKRYLAIHEQTIHNYYGEGVPPQEKGFQCEICGVKVKWKNNLLAHMRIHTGEKPYKCKICGEEYTCHGTFRTHLSKHAICSTPNKASTLIIQQAYLENRREPASGCVGATIFFSSTVPTDN